MTCPSTLSSPGSSWARRSCSRRGECTCMNMKYIDRYVCIYTASLFHAVCCILDCIVVWVALGLVLVCVSQPIVPPKPLLSPLLTPPPPHQTNQQRLHQRLPHLLPDRQRARAHLRPSEQAQVLGDGGAGLPPPGVPQPPQRARDPPRQEHFGLPGERRRAPLAPVAGRAQGPVWDGPAADAGPVHGDGRAGSGGFVGLGWTVGVLRFWGEEGYDIYRD